MRLKILMASMLLALGIAPPASAVPVEIDFDNLSISGSAGITGTIFGLDNEDGTSTPSAIQLGIGNGLTQYTLTSELFGGISFASGQVAGGAIQQSTPVVGVGPSGFGPFTLSELIISVDGAGQRFFISLFEDNGQGRIGEFAAFTVREVTAVPIPANALLLLTGLGGL
ncbi:MAG: hypothetical protein ACFB03_19470 [Paracoccaceae bacterium]